MINGTKLLNVAGMTRGRRDGILKSEKIRHVVKIGPMHLKGVWYVFLRQCETKTSANTETGFHMNGLWTLPTKRRLQSYCIRCSYTTSERFCIILRTRTGRAR